MAHSNRRGRKLEKEDCTNHIKASRAKSATHGICGCLQYAPSTSDQQGAALTQAGAKAVSQVQLCWWRHTEAPATQDNQRTARYDAGDRWSVVAHYLPSLASILHRASYLVIQPDQSKYSPVEFLYRHINSYNYIITHPNHAGRKVQKIVPYEARS